MSGSNTAMRNVGTRRGRWLMLLALTALVSGIAVIIVAIGAQRQAASPSPSAWGTIPGAPDSSSSQTPATTRSSTPASTTPSPTPRAGATSSAERPQPAPLPASDPVRISIPAIGVDSTVFPIGKDASGGLQAPPPGPNLNHVAWYKYSPTPGQDGPAVLEGHVDTIHGPSVFLQLGALHPGDTISVTRADGSIVRFVVDAVRAYASHNDFPTQVVYGGDLSQPTLRLITCSNFDRSIGHYVGNTIVFAHLTGSSHA